MLKQPILLLFRRKLDLKTRNSVQLWPKNQKYYLRRPKFRPILYNNQNINVINPVLDVKTTNIATISS